MPAPKSAKKTPAKKPTAKKAPAKAPAKSAAAKKPAPAARRPIPAKAKSAPAKPAPKPAAKPVAAAKPAATFSRPQLWQPQPVAAKPLPQAERSPTPVDKSTYENSLLVLTAAYMWRYYFIFICSSAITFSVTEIAYRYLPPAAFTQKALIFGILLLIYLGMAVYVFKWLLDSPSLFRRAKLTLTPTQPRRLRQIFLFWLSFFWRSFLLNFLLGMVVVLFNVWWMLRYGSHAPQPPEIAAVAITYLYVIAPTISAYLSFRLLLKKQNFGWGKLELLTLKR